MSYISFEEFSNSVLKARSHFDTSRVELLKESVFKQLINKIKSAPLDLCNNTINIYNDNDKNNQCTYEDFKNASQFFKEEGFDVKAIVDTSDDDGPGRPGYTYYYLQFNLTKIK